MTYKEKLIELLTEKVKESEDLSGLMADIASAMLSEENHQSRSRLLSTLGKLSKKFAVLNQEILFLSIVLKTENLKEEQREAA